MAEGIGNLVGDKVQIRTASGSDPEGILRGADDNGVLISGDHPEHGPRRVFIPWARITHIRANGEYEPPKGGEVNSF